MAFYGETGYGLGSGEVRSPYFGYLERMFPGCEVKAGDPSLLVNTVNKGVTMCVDGRRPNGWHIPHILRGPKIQGATEGLSMLMAKAQGRSEVDEDFFRNVCEQTVSAGYRPGLHDFEHDPLHCGHGKLAYSGAFAYEMPNLLLTPRRMVEIVKAYGGTHVELPGKHKEEIVRVNLRYGTTLEAASIAFNVDAWLAGVFGLNQDDILQNALATVIGLNSPARTIEFFT